MKSAAEADAYLTDAPSVLYRLFITSHDLASFPDAQKYCAEGYRRFPANPNFTGCKLMLLTMPQAEPKAGEAWRLVDSLKAKINPAAWPLKLREGAMYAAVALVREGARSPSRQRALVDSARRVAERNRGDERIDPGDELLGREAFVRAQLGDKEQALDLLKRYVSKHPEHAQGFKTGNFWGWAPLRDDPRFNDILALAR